MHTNVKSNKSYTPENMFHSRLQNIIPELCSTENQQNSHECLVVGSDFLNVQIVLGVDERLGGAVGAGHAHHGRHVLERVGRLHAHLAGAVVRVTHFEHHRELGVGQLKMGRAGLVKSELHQRCAV